MCKNIYIIIQFCCLSACRLKQEMSTNPYFKHKLSFRCVFRAQLSEPSCNTVRMYYLLWFALFILKVSRLSCVPSLKCDMQPRVLFYKLYSFASSLECTRRPFEAEAPRSTWKPVLTVLLQLVRICAVIRVTAARLHVSITMLVRISNFKKQLFSLPATGDGLRSTSHLVFHCGTKQKVFFF